MRHGFTGASDVSANLRRCACLVCGDRQAHSCSIGVWEECHCPECGLYRVSKGLLERMQLENQRFNVVATRSWLQARRSSDPLPMITLEQAMIQTN